MHKSSKHLIEITGSLLICLEFLCYSKGHLFIYLCHGDMYKTELFSDMWAFVWVCVCKGVACVCGGGVDLYACMYVLMRRNRRTYISACYTHQTMP